MPNLIYLIRHPQERKFLPDTDTHGLSGHPDGLKFSHIKLALIEEGFEIGNNSIDHLLVDFEPRSPNIFPQQQQRYGTIIRRNDEVFGVIHGYSNEREHSLQRMIDR